VTPVVNIVSDFSEGIRLIKLLDNILEVRHTPAANTSAPHRRVASAAHPIAPDGVRLCASLWFNRR